MTRGFSTTIDVLVRTVDRCSREGDRIGERVAHPGVAASAVLLLVQARERAAPADVMRRLAAVRAG